MGLGNLWAITSAAARVIAAFVDGLDEGAQVRLISAGSDGVASL